MKQAADPDYEQFKNLFLQLTGINLVYYKEEQMRRRLSTLRAKRGFSSFVRYFYALQQSEKLLNECLNRITINVTEFFRNRPRWAVLEQRISRLAAERSRLNVWSAACSTGEEAYSLVILLKKYLPDHAFHITATDIDCDVLQKASEGQYPSTALKELSAKERRAYFTQNGMTCTVNHSMKKSIRFSQNNLLSDPAPGTFDLIVCRNVLIYFTEEGKRLIYPKLSGALRKDGLLFVGSTEQIFHPEHYLLRPAETFFYEKMQ